MDELSEVFSGTKPLTRVEKNGKLFSFFNFCTSQNLDVKTYVRNVHEF